MKVNRWFITISIIIGITLLYSRCINNSLQQTADVRGKAYAGSSTCMKCHKEVYTNYLHTGHFQTSAPVTSLHDKRFSARDSFVFNHTTVIVEKRDSGIYQVAYSNGEELMSKRLDVAFGSGSEAFSFGYWQDKRLYQLPLSYFASINGWANSPGFPSNQAYFERPIIRRCFECHSSYVGEDADNVESVTQARKLDKNSIIYGIDCERCHGPAANHVVFHTENPLSKEPRYITRWGSLSRQQRLDVCGVCHSGNDLTTQKSTFSFVPGDTLSNFYYPEFSADLSAAPDVHGKQAQLLAASLCFQKSNTLECSSCHNVHESKAPGIDGYSKQCISCHQTAHKDVAVKTYLSKSGVTNCIDCHMPREASRLISFQLTGKNKADSYLLRTHRIAVYPKETERIILQHNKAPH